MNKCYLCASAPLREMLLYVQMLFHTPLRHGLRPFACYSHWRDKIANMTAPSLAHNREGN